MARTTSPWKYWFINILIYNLRAIIYQMEIFIINDN